MLSLHIIRSQFHRGVLVYRLHIGDQRGKQGFRLVMTEENEPVRRIRRPLWIYVYTYWMLVLDRKTLSVHTERKHLEA